MKKTVQLYEGKAKKVYATDDPELVIVSYKDDATALDGLKKGTVAGKGVVNNKMSNFLCRLLESRGVNTHYVKELSDRETLVKKVSIVPLEVIIRNISAGSFAKRYGVEEGIVFKSPTIEFSYKNDDLHDPLMNAYHAVALKLATWEEIELIKKYAFAVNDALKAFWGECGVTLVDFKLEFGKTADGTIVSMGVTYSTIVFLFATVNMASLAFEKLFQAVGRMKLTMIALISGCVCNILLDPVLIFGLGPVPAMGIAGAALATGIGQAATLIIYLVVYNTTESPVHLRRKALRPDLSLEGRLYAIGVPAILNLALPSLLVTFLNGLLAAFSESYVVVLGIYYKLQTFLYLPANGIVQGMRPLIGYNYGAKEHARVAKLYQLTLGMSAVIMAAGTVICMAASAPLIGLFSSNPETIAIGQTALRIICLGFVVSAVSTTSSGALEGLGKGAASLVISLCRYVIFIMPLAWLLCRQLGPTGVWHAFWVTEVLSAVIAFAVYRKSVIKK